VERSGPLTDRFRRGDRQAGVAADATVSRDRTTEYGPWVTPVAGTDDRPARSGLSPVAGRPPRTASSDLPRKRIDGEETTMNERLRVVVGIDGSAESRAALRFALEEAAVRGTGLRVVSALLPPMYWPEAYGLSAPPTVEEKKAHLRVGARRMLDEVIAERPTLAAVPVELHEVEGRPADVLVEQSRGADMLVVGHRGRGGRRQRSSRLRGAALRAARAVPRHGDPSCARAGDRGARPADSRQDTAHRRRGRTHVLIRRRRSTGASVRRHHRAVPHAHPHRGANLRDRDRRIRPNTTQPAQVDEPQLAAVDRWWRAANYLAVGQIYLLDNPLLTEPLRPEHIKPRLLGHWGTTPGLTFLWAHLNRVIRR
jgi:nucleotide-binding universal stress UspA family protein